TQSTVARLTVLMFKNMSWSSMVALCICLRNFTDTVQWKIQEYYAPDKAVKLVLSCHSSVSYLFPLLNVHIYICYIWLSPLSSLLHGQPMVDHMVDHSGPNLIRDNGSPSCSFSSSSSSSSFLSSSYSHFSACLITSHFNISINCSPNQELTYGHHIAKALISNCTTALEREVLPFE